MHGLHHVQFVALSPRNLFVDQGLRNHAHHPTAGLCRGLGHHAHQAVVASAVNELALVLPYPSAYRLGGLGVGRRVAHARSTVNT